MYTRDLIGKVLFTTAEAAQAKIALTEAIQNFQDTIAACEKLRHADLEVFFSKEELVSFHNRLQTVLKDISILPCRVGDTVKITTSGAKQRLRNGRFIDQREHPGTELKVVEIVRYMRYGALIKVVDNSLGYDREFYLTSSDVKL